MAGHSAETLDQWSARQFRAALDRLAPQATDLDRLREIAARGPVAFAREALGFTPWSRQSELLDDACRYMQLALRSGHKTGKSTSFAVLALWFYVRYPGARVIIMGPGYRQVQQIIWREIQRLWRGAKIPLPGRISELASTGAVDPATSSQIIGYTSDKREAIAGISGSYIMYLVDEASGVPEAIFNAIEGNRAGGNAWLLMASNPTRADGEFYDAFHRKSVEALGPDYGYHTVHIDSRHSPNVTGECKALGYPDGIPGLATTEFIERLKATAGEDSAEFKIKVEGSFAYAELLKIMPLHTLQQMQERWAETPAEGTRQFGIDAGGIGRDPLGLAYRQGQKIEEVREHYKIGTDAAVVPLLLAFAEAHGGLAGSTVVIDSDGETGARQYAELRQYHLAQGHGQWRLVRFRGSDKPAGIKVQQYTMNRDLLHAQFRDWAKSGGAIPPHAELERQLHAPEFGTDIRQRLKVTPKDGEKGLRALLGRSPDLAEAAMLACWVPSGGLAVTAAAPQAAPEGRTFDPLALIDEGRSGGNAFDPYAAGL